MAVVSVTRLTRSMNSEKDKRTAVDRYRVILNAIPTTMNEVRTAVDPNTGMSVPLRGDIYDVTDPSMVCRNIQCDQEVESDWQAYICVANYSTGELITEIENPLDIPPKVRWDFVGSDEEVNEDRNGAPIANSAGQPLRLTNEVFDLVAVCTGNALEYSPLVAMQFMNAVNETAFLIRGWSINPKVGKITQFTAEEMHSNGIDYHAITIVIRFRGQGWIRKVLDQGTMALGTDGKPQQIRDGMGTLVTEDQRLDGNGFLLPEGANPEWLNFDFHQPQDFSQLNLPA